MRRIEISNRVRIAFALALAALGPAAPASAQAPRPKAAPAATAPAPAAATPKAAAPATSFVAQPPGPEADAKLADLMKRWEQNSSSVKSLRLNFTREDIAAAWGDKTDYQGQAVLMAPNLAWLDTNKVATSPDGKKIVGKDGKPEVVPDERIICTGDEVWQYKSPTKQILVYPLAKEAKQRALEEGPLPFLFNMKADQAMRRYGLKLEGEMTSTYVIGVKPLQQIDRESFSLARLYLDKKLLQPVALVLIDVNGQDQKRYRFFNIEPNVALPSNAFQGREVKGWKLERNAGMAGAPAATPAPRAAVKGPVRQPAMTPAGPAGRRR